MSYPASNWSWARVPARGQGATGSVSWGANTEGRACESVNVREAGKEATVTHLTRRSVLRGSLALAAARPFVGPHIARAAATTATVWFAQGFVQDEDVALRKAVADYEKASGNKIELSITPFAPERQKIRSEEHTSELQSLTNLVCR